MYTLILYTPPTSSLLAISICKNNDPPTFKSDFSTAIQFQFCRELATLEAKSRLHVVRVGYMLMQIKTRIVFDVADMAI